MCGWGAGWISVLLFLLRSARRVLMAGRGLGQGGGVGGRLAGRSYLPKEGGREGEGDSGCAEAVPSTSFWRGPEKTVVGGNVSRLLGRRGGTARGGRSGREERARGPAWAITRRRLGWLTFPWPPRPPRPRACARSGRPLPAGRGRARGPCLTETWPLSPKRPVGRAPHRLRGFASSSLLAQVALN